uniref:Uncharacterized protein n=1 Tax=Ditylenchus dipsaci TaxID=166011 RepID=A0A915ETH6_9BILA
MDFIRALPIEILHEVYKYQGYDGTELLKHICGFIRRIEGKATTDRGLVIMDKELYYHNILAKITTMVVDSQFEAKSFVAVERVANLFNEAYLMRLDLCYKDLDVGKVVEQSKNSAKCNELADVCGPKRNDAIASALRTVAEFNANAEVKGRHMWMLDQLLKKTFPDSNVVPKVILYMKQSKSQRNSLRSWKAEGGRSRTSVKTKLRSRKLLKQAQDPSVRK